MEFHRYLSILRRRAVLVVATLVLAIAAGWLATPTTSEYAATTTVFVGSRQITNNGLDLSGDRIAGLDRLLLTYSSMIRSRAVASDALARSGVSLSADSVVDRMTVGIVPGTQLIAIRVTDPDPATAQALANGLGDAFAAQVQHFDGSAAGSTAPTSPGSVGELPSGLPAYVFERAPLPTSPAPRNLGHNLLLAGLFGLLVAGAAAFGLEYLDITIKGPLDAERRLNLPVLGAVPHVAIRALAMKITNVA